MRHILDLQQLNTPHATSRTEWEKLNWLPPHHPKGNRPNHLWHDWLTDGASLTRRLQKVSGQRFQVLRLQQQLIKPALHEAQLLDMATNDYAIVRQVALLGFEQPWVFARTVIPLPTLNQGNRHLLLLGNRSLGSVLFKDPNVQRTSIEITSNQPDFFAPFIWGRRSRFTIGNAPLLVTELFLEPFRQYIQLPPLNVK